MTRILACSLAIGDLPKPTPSCLERCTLMAITRRLAAPAATAAAPAAPLRDRLVDVPSSISLINGSMTASRVGQDRPQAKAIRYCRQDLEPHAGRTGAVFQSLGWPSTPRIVSLDAYIGAPPIEIAAFGLGMARFR